MQIVEKLNEKFEIENTEGGGGKIKYNMRKIENMIKENLVDDLI